MKILFNDIIQYSNAPDTLKSPMLSETTNISGSTIITFDKQRQINSIGIGYTNGTTFTVTYSGGTFTFSFIGNGLYIMPDTINISQITISTNGTYIGRIGAGMAVNIPTSITKEPAYCSTAEPRMTLSGQIIKGAGGYNYRQISLDSRYKIDSSAMNEISEGYKYIGMGYPFFLDLTDESYKIPFSKFYGIDSNQQKMSFESGVKKYLYSRRFEFRECF